MTTTDTVTPLLDITRRIARRECLDAASMTPAERSALADRLFEVYSDTVHGFDRRDFESQVFAADDVRLALFYGAEGELAGFACAHVERIAHDDRTYAVLCASLYFRLGYRGGTSGALFCLREALRFKLREPRTPLVYVTRCASPAVYRLLASTMPEVYPSRTRQTPSDVEALVRIVGQRWGYVPVTDGPWVVSSVATPHEPSRLRRLDSDPDARFYLRMNPRFAEGDALVVWTPLSAANIAGGIFRLLRGKLGR
ncbi:hypothetical protein [Gordonia rhizosphera]|uniref:Uncharacterized protein n=1 Tax=Gordonia rhizosphera NBRC 16068 TaxID=1108045 RepID=K6V623_9ACTN|nr:hypothetical protein [Gordonia rhizosphera]GAB91713.1 hypothetical protein GORHZ_141_00890 [Gordonia rhizosphera NBRC 16068]